ncbi:MAG TPA: polysaccharide deacetylase family protein [Pseudonocardiaceae bacterium]|nr:polysaccharide deacetylase family protein [Pseudonocardiaceae bacterium]
MGCWHDRRDRRAFLGILGVGLAAVVTGCTSPSQTPPAAQPQWPPPPLLTPPVDEQEPPAAQPEQSAPPLPTPPVGEQERPAAQPGQSDPPLSTPPVGESVPPSPAAQPGGRVAVRGGPAGTPGVALTIDDGYCAGCVAGYVAFAQRTGIHLTFSPNGRYAHAWAPQATVLRPLIEAGQVQIMNHTFSHSNLTRLRPDQVRHELDRNEQWITTTFATTARPYYRPPYGAHNPDVDNLAAEVGFDRVVMWNGSFGDAQLVTPQFLMTQAYTYLRPGVIMLGHANHPTVLGLFDQISHLLRDRQLQAVTLDEMFGTRR